MIRSKSILFGFLMLTRLSAEEYNITKTVDFDTLNHSYDACEARMIDAMYQTAIEKYIGCKTDVSAYDIKIYPKSIRKRAINIDSCSIESTVKVTSEFLESHDYYRGNRGVICGGYDPAIEVEDAFWNSFEVGVSVGLSGKQEEVKLRGDNKEIFLEYDTTMLVGMNAAYRYKIYDSQYIGLKVFVAKGFESYTDNISSKKVRNDGSPSILRLGGGALWGYRYHVKTDFSLGANYLYDSLSRNYINMRYTGNISRFNVEAVAGYLVMPYLKIWGSVASDLSANIGISGVFGTSNDVKEPSNSSSYRVKKDFKDNN